MTDNTEPAAPIDIAKASAGARNSSTEHHQSLKQQNETAETQQKNPHRQKRKKQFRKRRQSLLEEEEEEEKTKDPTQQQHEEEEEHSYLRSLKEIQKGRQRKRGLEVETLLQAPAREAEQAQKEKEEAEKKEQEEEETPQYGLKDTKKSKKQRREAVGKFLGGTFTAQTTSDITGLGASTLQDLESNPYMQQYVEQRMKEIRKQRGQAASDDSDSDNEQGNNKQKRQKDPVEKEVGDLYELPEHLKPPKPASNAEESGEGAPLFLNTGLAEVELPEEVKRKNVEETERAKRDYLRRMKQQEENKKAFASLPNVGGSITANYKQHRREYAEKMNSQDTFKHDNFKQQHHEPAKPNEGRQQHHQHQAKATDDMVLNRFKKAAWAGKR